MSKVTENVSVRVDFTKNDAHSRTVVYVLYFPLSNIVVTGSFDNEIRIWRLKRIDLEYKIEMVKRIDSHESHHIAKHGDDAFLSCSNDLSVKSFSIRDPYNELKHFDLLQSGDDHRHTIKRICVIPENLTTLVENVSGYFLALVINSRLRLVSYDEGKVLNKFILEGTGLMGFSKLIHSKLHKDVVYVNTSSHRITSSDGTSKLSRSILMINYIKGTIEKRYFDETDLSGDIYSIETFLEEDHGMKRREIVVGGGIRSKVYFYDSLTSVLFRIVHMGGAYVSSFLPFSPSSHLLVGMNRSLICMLRTQPLKPGQTEEGKSIENHHVLSIEEAQDSEISVCGGQILESKCDYIEGFDLFSAGEEEEEGVRVLVACGDRSLRIVLFENLRIQLSGVLRDRKQSLEDLRERVLFLVAPQFSSSFSCESFYSQKDSNFKIFFPQVGESLFTPKLFVYVM